MVVKFWHSLTFFLLQNLFPSWLLQLHLFWFFLRVCCTTFPFMCIVTLFFYYRGIHPWWRLHHTIWWTTSGIWDMEGTTMTTHLVLHGCLWWCMCIGKMRASVDWQYVSTVCPLCSIMLQVTNEWVWRLLPAGIQAPHGGFYGMQVLLGTQWPLPLSPWPRQEEEVLQHGFNWPFLLAQVIKSVRKRRVCAFYYM